MSDIIDSDGLHLKDYSTTLLELENAIKAIYGPDVNIDSNSRDGLCIGIFNQAATDKRELFRKVFSSFDVDQAEGRVLDQRIALLNMKRKGGSFTYQLIEITVDRSLTLTGLDLAVNDLAPNIKNLFTVRDDAGTLFYLVSTYSFVGAGTESRMFRAAEYGRVETLPGTITTPTTVIRGVTNIVNTSSPSTLGSDEESDAEIKLRKATQGSFVTRSYLAAIRVSLLQLPNVTGAFVYENDTHINPDANGIPSHCIWAIVENGLDTDIADVLYDKRSLGVRTFGSESVIVNRPNQQPYLIRFDRPSYGDLYIRFLVTPALSVLEEDALKAKIVSELLWEVGQTVTTDIIVCFVRNYLGTGYSVTSIEVSGDGAFWVEILPVTGLDHKWLADVGRITIL